MTGTMFQLIGENEINTIDQEFLRYLQNHYGNTVDRDEVDTTTEVVGSNTNVLNVLRNVTWQQRQQWQLIG